MEVLLLALDVVCIILLCRGVNRVSRSGDPKDMGLFAYLETKRLVQDTKKDTHA